VQINLMQISLLQVSSKFYNVNIKIAYVS